MKCKRKSEEKLQSLFKIMLAQKILTFFFKEIKQFTYEIRILRETYKTRYA